MSKYNLVYSTLQKARIWEIWQKMNPDSLTVLNYRRVGKPDATNLYYRHALSATPAEFGAHLDYLQENYSIISTKDILSWFKNERELPERAALITFDDCYQDNFIYAFPELQKRWLSAIFFLATENVNTSTPMFWDLVGYAMSRTKKNQLSLNLLGTFTWNSEEESELNKTSIVQAIRSIPPKLQNEAIDEIIQKLDVSVPKEAFQNQYLSWEQINKMVLEGIDFGSRTHSQRILSMIPMEIAQREIVDSKKQIEKVIDRPVVAFSYPRGQNGDYNRKIMKLLHQAGYIIAFTNSPGPDEYSDFPKKRYAIRRVSIHYQDSFPKFVAKLNGAPQFVDFFTDLF